ncbi:uncharacterized protein V1518DRAFT_416507 [Limtongia smithiae]|uniref:uncharacterized protein n=1 Tax=Limtongia smithiae TaxID=1125753 RepID=UPI0034CFC6FC
MTPTQTEAVDISSRQSRTRVRTGCKTCRSRHRKCDEARPACANCRSRKLDCQWGEMLIFVESQSSRQVISKRRLTKPSTAAIKNLQIISEIPTVEISDISTATTINTRPAQNSLAPEFSQQSSSQSAPTSHSSERSQTEDAVQALLSLDNVATATSNSPMSTEHLSSSKSTGTPGGDEMHLDDELTTQMSTPFMPTETTHRSPIVGPHTQTEGIEAGELDLLNDPGFTSFEQFDGLHDTLRDYMFLSARSTAPTRASSPAPGHSTVDREVACALYVSDSLTLMSAVELSKADTTHLMRNYIDEVGPWLDMFDYTRTFTTIFAKRSLDCPPLFYAILAISARQLERVDLTYSSTISLALYQQSIKSLLPPLEHFQESRDVLVVAACVVLCCLEMMSSLPQNWRRHLEGCAALFASIGIHGFSGDLGQAVFWCFARMDLSSAVIGEESTIINVQNWIPEGQDVNTAGVLFRASGTCDMYANYAVFLCARAMDLISFESLKSGEELEVYKQRWEILWKDLQEWERLRPADMLPILSYEPEGDNPFNTVVYSNGPAISGNQLYHMACILLMQNKPRGFKFDKGTQSILRHAKLVCAISLSNTHHGCWNNAIQPLWIAGRLMSHRTEHAAILGIFEQIERTTGWAMRWRGEDLKEFWGPSG